VQVCKNQENVDVWLHHSVEKPASWRRTSGCTGGLTRSDGQAKIKALPPGPRVSPQAVLDGMEQLLEAQELYRQARGVHCSALSDGKRIRLQAEDIGRHNTLDKLAGLLLMEGESAEGWMVLTTGRISSEMLQKSARIGATVVVSRTSPTSQSTQAAEELGITLIGYARKTQFSVYAHPERLGLGVETVAEAAD
jgi:FdhD protein